MGVGFEVRLAMDTQVVEHAQAAEDLLAIGDLRLAARRRATLAGAGGRRAAGGAHVRRARADLRHLHGGMHGERGGRTVGPGWGDRGGGDGDARRLGGVSACWDGEHCRRRVCLRLWVSKWGHQDVGASSVELKAVRGILK